MNDDMQMAKGGIEGGWNLSVGEPVLIRQRLRLPELSVAGIWEYPGLGGVPDLVDELRALYPEYKHVVVTVGAKQAVAAAMRAVAVTKFTQPPDGIAGRWVSHPAPYWPSYPTLAGLVGAQFLPYGEGDWCVRCATSPNNPDGEEYLDPCDIWDAVYAHPVYGWSGRAPEHRVRIGSAAKMLGLAGTRVGWILTNDDAVAREASRFVEVSTSGVPLPSQHIVAAVMRGLREGRVSSSDLLLARGDMHVNGAIFRHYIGKHCETVKGVPSTDRGMYAYFKVLDPEHFGVALEKTRVRLVSGEACGETKPGWWRMNMMEDLNYTQAALEKLSEALK